MIDLRTCLTSVHISQPPHLSPLSRKSLANSSVCIRSVVSRITHLASCKCITHGTHTHTHPSSDNKNAEADGTCSSSGSFQGFGKSSRIITQETMVKHQSFLRPFRKKDRRCIRIGHRRQLRKEPNEPSLPCSLLTYMLCAYATSQPNVHQPAAASCVRSPSRPPLSPPQCPRLRAEPSSSPLTSHIASIVESFCHLGDQSPIVHMSMIFPSSDPH